MKQQFNIHIQNAGNHRLQPVDGKLIKDHTLLPIKLFIHHGVICTTPLEYYPSWTISEFETGAHMATDKTQKAALLDLTERVNKRGTTVSQMQDIIADTVKRWGKAN